MNRHVLTAGAVLGLAALTTLVSTPAVAAAHVSQANASALTVTVAGTDSTSGTYGAVNDGSGERTTGEHSPRLTLLGGQQLITEGTLNQDAAALVDHGNGHSAACAGLAGQGATLVAVGDTRCLTGGRTLTLNAGTLDLSKLDLVQTGTPLDQVSEALKPVVTPVLGSITKALSSGLAQVGNPGLNVNVGAIQARCTATRGSASGDSELAGVNVTITVPGQPPVVLVTLPVHPKPNTDVLVNLDDVVAAVITALKTDLNQSLNKALGPVAAALGDALDTVKGQIIDEAVKALRPQLLTALSDNVLKAVLNKQSHPTADSIDVTALDVHVLPAADASLGKTFLDLQVGRVTCGPNGRVAAPEAAPKVKAPVVPTSVPAGLAGTPDHGHSGILAAEALGALLLLAGAGALVAHRRRGL